MNPELSGSETSIAVWGSLTRDGSEYNGVRATESSHAVTERRRTGRYPGLGKMKNALNTLTLTCLTIAFTSGTL